MTPEEEAELKKIYKYMFTEMAILTPAILIYCYTLIYWCPGWLAGLNGLVAIVTAIVFARRHPI